MVKKSEFIAKRLLAAIQIVSFFALGLAGSFSHAGEWRLPEPVKDGETPQWFNAPLPWARPLIDGRIDALLLSPWEALRDAVELESRIDLRLARAGYCETRCAEGEGESGPGASGEGILGALLDDGLDVVILANLDFASVPPGFLEELVSRVEDGLGLVVYRFNRDMPAALRALFDSANRLEDNTEITRGLGSSFVPEWSDGFHFVGLYEYGAGRVADLAYDSEAPSAHALVPPPDGPGDYSEILAFEDHMSLAARAILWSARRGGKARIANVAAQLPEGPLETQIPPFLPREYIQGLRDASLPQGLVPFRVALDRPAERAYELAYSLRFPTRALHWKNTEIERIAKGQSSAIIHVYAGQGKFLLDVWLREKKRVVDWFTADVSLPGWPEIFDVQFSKDALRENDELTVTLQLRPHYSRARRCTVLFRAVDGWGRVVSERYVSVGPEAGKVSALLSFADLISPFLRIDVFAADVPGGLFSRLQLQKSAHAFMALPVRLQPRTVFRFAAAGSGAFERNARARNLSLAKSGVDTIVVSSASTTAIAPVVDNLRIAPRAAEYGLANGESALCLTDPQFLQSERDRLHDLASSYGARGGTIYTLGYNRGAARSPAHACRSETCALGFEAMLKDSFPSLDALNRTWGTRYARWDEVRASAGVPDAGEPLSRWLDSQLYRDRVIMNAHARALAVIRMADRGATVGAVMENIPRQGPGPPWRQFASRMDMVAAPNSPVAVEKLRSYTLGGTRTLMTIQPGGVERAGLPWRALLNGFDGLWLSNAFSGPASAMAGDALTPDGRPKPWFERVAAEVADLRSGYGLLFAKATRDAARIAVYDSRASRYINSLRPVRGASSEDSEGALARALNELGYAFDFVSSEDALAGGLQNYKAIVLPMASALSDSEMAVLREFASAGGSVIADILPGRYDDHGAPRADPPPAQLFASTELADSERGAQAWTVRRKSGALSAILHEPFPALSGSEKLLGQLDELLAESGVFKSGESLLLEAEGLRGWRVAYRYGEARILAFANVDEGESSDRRFRVRLGKEMFAYASRRGELLRAGKRHKIRLRPGEVELIAFLPYDVTRLILDVPETVRRGRRLHVGIGIRTRDKLPGNHVVHVTLAPRFGEPIAYYSRSLECEAGQGLASIPLALNEAVGEYTVTVRDALTGIVETATVAVVL